MKIRENKQIGDKIKDPAESIEQKRKISKVLEKDTAVANIDGRGLS